MLTRADIIKKLGEQRTHLAAEFGVSRIGLFGSFARGSATDQSDIDLVVEFDQPVGFKFLELAEYLETLFEHRVDLLTPAGIQNIRRKRIADAISHSVVYV